MADLIGNKNDGDILYASDINNMLAERDGHFLPVSNSTRNYVDATQNIGSATYRFVNGYFSTAIITPKIQAESSAGLSLFDDGGNGIFVRDGGNVGIGTTLPTAKLDVNGNMVITGTVSVSSDVISSGSGLFSGAVRAQADIITKTDSNDIAVGIYNAAGSIRRACLYANTGGSGKGGIILGDDVNLYRDSANVLKTDDDLIIAGTVSVGSHVISSGSGLFSAVRAQVDIITKTDSNDIAVGIYNSAGLIRRACLYANAGGSGKGGIILGDDVNLYRDSANVLKTDDDLIIAGTVSVGSHVISSGSGLFSAVRAQADIITKTDLTDTAVGIYNSAGSIRLACLYMNVGGSGKSGILLGDLISGADVNLYRDSANVLKTDDNFVVLGTVGIGTSAPDKALEINHATGDCLRLTYNDSNGSASNYANFTISSGGDLTISSSGGDTKIQTVTFSTGSNVYSSDGQFIFQDDVQIAADETINVLGKLYLSSETPASSTATGTTGQITWDSSYIYVAVGTNSWKRAAISASEW